MTEPDDPAPILFGAPMLPDSARLAALTAEALSHGWLTNGGVLHMRLEQALTAAESPGDAVSLVSSGTMALMLALALGNLPSGAEVITTPLTFAATAQAIQWSGLRPVFADVDPDSLNICPRAVSAAITPRTAAILPVHFLGVPCDVVALAEIAAHHALWLVYDAAHAFGVRRGGLSIGAFGDATAFSLHATKVLHTCEGGYVVTRRDRVRHLRRMRNFGLDAGVPVGPGLNGKLSELHAATGLALLPDLASEIASRHALRRAYDAALAGLPGLRLHAPVPGAKGAPNYYAIRLRPDLRERVALALAGARILVRDHFPVLCGPGALWDGHPIVTADGQAPAAPRVGPEILCLPLHGRMEPADVDRIAAVIRAALRDAATQEPDSSP